MMSSENEKTESASIAINEVQLDFGGKTHIFSLERTGIAVLALPLSVLRADSHLQIL